MQAIRSDVSPAGGEPETAAVVIAVVADLLVVRLSAAGGATRAEVVRDLSSLMAHRLSPGELREAVDAALVRVLVSRFASERRGRYMLTEEGRGRATELLGKRPLPEDWTAIRDVRLVAAALGLADDPHTKFKTLERPDGLRAAVLAQVYGLKLGRTGRSSASRLRGKLAVAALDRAFGNRIRSGLGDERGLSARAGRILAGQLLLKPRDLGTDGRLIATLAAEAVAAAQTDAGALRAALLKRYVSWRIDGNITGPDQAARKASPIAKAQPQPKIVPASREASFADVTDSATGALVPASQPVAAPTATRPDMDGFVVAVKRAAEAHAEGWPGNRKAFVCYVWEAVQRMHPDWGLSAVEFKAMLTEAHRTGNLALANADLANKARAKELQASAIPYKNTVWHYVRVEEAA